MKLAFCLFKYFPYSGLSRDFMRIMLECCERGHDIHIFASEWQGPRPDGVRITLLPTRSWLMNHARNTSFYRKVKPHLRDGAFDAVIGFNKMPGLDIYYGADYCYVGRATPRYSRLYRLTPRYHHFHTFERAVFGLQSQTNILSLSEREKTVYQQFYGTPDHRFHLLPPTLDKTRRRTFDSHAMRSKVRGDLGISSDQHLLLFVGSGFKTKGLDRAINALASLPTALRSQCRLFVIGQDNASYFERLAANLALQDNVRFLGGRDDIPELLSAGDLMIHPAYSENTGTVLLEAITSGLPVLTTDVCGYAPHIEKANAGVVLKSPFSQARLDQQLVSMLQSSQRAVWSANGLAYGENLDLYQMPETAATVIERWTELRKEANDISVVEMEKGTSLYLRSDFRELQGPAQNFDDIMALNGEVIRKAPGRKTKRFSRNNEAFYIKAHTGVGWQEILKNLLYFRLPVLGATNEWHGIHWIRRLGIDTLSIAGYGTTSGNPAKLRSFILTDEISGAISLEDFCGQWSTHPPRTAAQIQLKRALIQRVAEIARAMHTSGANHRDFYLCHFLLKTDDLNLVAQTHRKANNHIEQGQNDSAATSSQDLRLYLIDLHRMQLRRRTPTRWVVKDIAGLFYSAMDIQLSKSDLLRFIKEYRARPLRDIMRDEQNFWRRVETRAVNLYASEARRAQRRAMMEARSAQSTASTG